MASKSKTKFTPLRRFGRGQTLAFVLVFAAVGGFFIYRSFAASSLALGSPNIDIAHSVSAFKVPETTTKSKKNSTIVELRNTGTAASSKVALTTSKVTLDKGVYKACAYMRSVGGTITGKLIVNGINGGVIGKALSATQSFTISNTTEYKSSGCTSFSYDASDPSVEVTISNTTAGATLRVSSAIIEKTGSLPPPPPPPTTGNCDETNLKFCDDFTGSTGSKPDSSKWDVMSGASGWGVECFTESPNNIQQDGQGNLKLVVRKESGCGRDYTSGGIETNRGNSNFTFQYGDVEIRAKAACGGGVWPALWTSTGDNGPGWPNSGEIDILEIMDGDQYNAQQTIHGGPSHWQKNTSNKSSKRWCEDWHTYGVDWRKGSLKFKIDGVVKHTLTPSDVPSGQKWPFDSYNQRLLVDLQIGSWGGTINNNDLPSTMLVDYVKVYN